MAVLRAPRSSPSFTSHAKEGLIEDRVRLIAKLPLISCKMKVSPRLCIRINHAEKLASFRLEKMVSSFIAIHFSLSVQTSWACGLISALDLSSFRYELYSNPR